MDLQTYIARTQFLGTGSSSQTNFDDFIPEVYRIKNSCKGRLIQTKIEEEDYYSSDYSEPVPKVRVKQEKLQFRSRKHNSRRRKDKPYKCNFCSFITAWKCNIIRHRQQHTREKIFGCHLCSYTALQKSNLRTHIRIHMGDKRFHCGFCDYKTMYKSTLDMHVLKHTRGRRQKYLKQFRQSMSIDSDIKSEFDAHTDEKNFKRELCDYENAVIKTEDAAESQDQLKMEDAEQTDLIWDLSLETADPKEPELKSSESQELKMENTDHLDLIWDLSLETPEPKEPEREMNEFPSKLKAEHAEDTDLIWDLSLDPPESKEPKTQTELRLEDTEHSDLIWDLSLETAIPKEPKPEITKPEEALAWEPEPNKEPKSEIESQSQKNLENADLHWDLTLESVEPKEPLEPEINRSQDDTDLIWDLSLESSQLEQCNDTELDEKILELKQSEIDL